MNPLPNRPILSNPSITMAIPNVPPFESMPYNGRPRKILPEAGKEFPILNGMTALAGPSGGQISNISHSQSGEHPSGHIPQPPGPPPSSASQPLPQQTLQQPPDHQEPPEEKEPIENSGTAIFRPGDDWKEKLRQSHEAAQNRGQTDSSDLGWQDDGDLKDDDSAIEDDESVSSEGDGSKIWKAKKTLRK
jgi:striatin 1/3/4